MISKTDISQLKPEDCEQLLCSDELLKNIIKQTIVKKVFLSLLTSLTDEELYDGLMNILSEVIAREIRMTTLDDKEVDEQDMGRAVEDCIDALKSSTELRDLYEETLMCRLVKGGYFDETDD